MKKREEIRCLDEVTAIVPGYDEGGALTRVFTKKCPEQRVRLTVRAVLKRLAAAYGKNLEVLREQSAKHTRLEQGGILAFSPGVVLMPWKVCKPRVPKDPTLGFLNVAYGVKLNQAKKELTLALPGGETLPVLWTQKTFFRHHVLAKSMFIWVNARGYQELSRAKGQYEELLQGLA
ncbi:MAG: hypothetical protein IJ849_01075 [Selenomonadaceae bacterium]|nr:hypothetical protein [Selenomonadaceae bacterium]